MTFDLRNSPFTVKVSHEWSLSRFYKSEEGFSSGTVQQLFQNIFAENLMFFFNDSEKRLILSVNHKNRPQYDIVYDSFTFKH